MSVFLRWGVFGILGVAALVYAYNASKRMAEKHGAREVAQVAVAPAAPMTEPAPVPVPVQPEHPVASPACEAELIVAQRALEARAAREPLDRLLRIQEIAFAEQPRRSRLEKVAADWFGLAGPEPDPEGLRIAVISSCVKASPAP
jgi:hypothetical protein